MNSNIETLNKELNSKQKNLNALENEFHFKIQEFDKELTDINSNFKNNFNNQLKNVKTK